LSHLRFLFDEATGAGVLGCAVAGIAFALAARPRSDAPAELSEVGGWLAGAGVAAAIAIALPEILPLGPIPFHVVTVLAQIAPFWCTGRGLDLLLRGGSSRSWGAGVAGKVGGALLAPACLDLGPYAVGWACALALAAAGVALGGTRRIRRRLAAGLAVGVAAATLGHGGLPRRVDDPAGLAKPALAEMAPDGRAELVSTAWGAGGRTDEITFRGQEAELRWHFEDGTSPVPVPVGDADADWWRARFPLIGLPFAATDPAKVLVIGATDEAERAVAARFAPAELRSLAGEEDARRALRAGSGSFDLALLVSCHSTRSAWLHANARDDRLWTREAFAEAWSCLRPGGTLAVATSDERLFARAVATLVADGPPLASRAWGFRVGEAGRAAPHRFLALAWSEPPPEAVARRVRDAATGWGAVPLFGPGIAVSPPWDALAGERPAEGLGRAFSRRAGAWLDLSPATDARPGFFRIARDEHPWRRWLVATCLAALLAVVFGPLGDERRRDLREGGLPLAAGLAELALLGAAFAFVLATLALRAPLVTGIALTRAPVALAALAGGFGVAWGRLARAGGGVRPGPTVVAALAVGPLLWGGEAAVVAAGTSAVRGVVAGAGAALVGAALAVVLASALYRLERRPGAVRWGWAAFGVAVTGGVPLAAWVAHAEGWPVVAGCVVAVQLASVGFAIWSRVARPSWLRAGG